MLFHVRIILGSRQYRKREDSEYDTATAHERERLQYSCHALYCRVHHLWTACQLDLQEDWTTEPECYDVFMGYNSLTSNVSQHNAQANIANQEYVSSVRDWSRPRGNSKRYAF